MAVPMWIEPSGAEYHICEILDPNPLTTVTRPPSWCTTRRSRRASHLRNAKYVEMRLSTHPDSSLCPSLHSRSPSDGTRYGISCVSVENRIRPSGGNVE